MEIKQYPSINVKVNELIPNSYNPKKDLDDSDNKRQFEDLKHSLSKGYMLEIIVRENEEGHFEIVDGYHRYLALKEMGVEEIKVKNLGKLSWKESVEKTLNIEKIKIELDNVLTAELLKEYLTLTTIEEAAVDLPFSIEEITEQTELLDFDWGQFENDQVEVDDKLEDKIEDELAFSVKAPAEEVSKLNLIWSKIKETNDSEDYILLKNILQKFLDKNEK